MNIGKKIIYDLWTPQMFVNFSKSRCLFYAFKYFFFSLRRSHCFSSDSQRVPWHKKKWFNRLTPNDPYMGRTAPLTSKCCILYIYSTNIGTEYFKHALYSPFFFSSKCVLFHDANLFGSCIIHILYTGCVKIKKK